MSRQVYIDPQLEIKSRLDRKDNLDRYLEWVILLIKQNRSSEITGYKEWLNRLGKLN